MTETIQSPAPASPLLAALHQQIQSVAARDLDARMLIELERTCRIVRELLVVGQDPSALKPKFGFGIDGGMQYAMSANDYGNSNGAIYPAMSPPAETFGVSAIRELAAMLPGWAKSQQNKNRHTVTDLVKAVAAAKETGDTELQNELRRELREMLRENRDDDHDHDMVSQPDPQLEGQS